MKLEIDIPEHHYNNIIALDSVSLGRVPYKGIIMYAIIAIKRGKALEQEPTIEHEQKVDKSAMIHEIYMAGVNMAGEYQGCWVRFKEIEKIIDKYVR